jgi:hypothetical protein
MYCSYYSNTRGVTGGQNLGSVFAFIFCNSEGGKSVYAVHSQMSMLDYVVKLEDGMPE